MRSTGIVRMVDQLGRIVLPIELRKAMDIKEKDPLEIFTDDDRIILTKYHFFIRNPIFYIKKGFFIINIFFPDSLTDMLSKP